MAVHTLTLCNNGGCQQFNYEDGQQMARTATTMAILGRGRNWGMMAMRAAGNAKTARGRQEISALIQQGWKPQENDIHSKQLLMNMGIAY